MGPTEPKPPVFFLAGCNCAGLLPPICPKPRRPMPMPRRSTSALDFCRACEPGARGGLKGVGDRMAAAAAAAPDASLACCSSASGS